MRILLLGAGGFIGRHVMSELLSAGHDLVSVVRAADHLPEAFPRARFLEIDLARATDERTWLPHLQGIDCIVVAAGVLRGRQMAAVHVDMPRALYAAALGSGVRHVVLVSAISARQDVNTDYSASKLAGEDVLRRSGLAWTILRPSLVYGDGSYGGTSLLRGMAGAPFLVPLPGTGAFAFTPIHVADLARSIALMCGNGAFHGRVLEPVGPETVSLKDLLGRYRRWLGFGRARFLAVPLPLARAVARIGDVVGDGPVATNGLAQLVAGNAGDSASYAKAVGFSPRGLSDALLARPAQVQDRWHARLFFLAPAIRAVLVILWLVSGWLGFFHAAETTRDLVTGLGLPQALAGPIRIGAGVLDMALAVLVLLDRKARWSTLAQLVVVLGYTIVLGVALPRLWLDPLGPLLKNLPILLLVAIHGAIGDKR